MKKSGLIIILLASLGLNAGLGYRLWRSGPATEETRAPGTRHERAGDNRQRFHRGARDSLWQKGLLDRRLRHMTRVLDLRPEQVAALQEIQRRHGEQVRREGLDMAAQRRQIRDLLAGSEPDPTRVRSLVHTMGQRRARLDSLVTETILQELEVMDPGQREAYLRMIAMEGDHFGEPGSGPRRGPGNGRPQGRGGRGGGNNPG